MDIKKEMTLTLCDESVKERASRMFESNYEFNGQKDRMPLEQHDISFRLFKPSSEYVNLEFLAKTPIGYFFQPVGFFDSKLNIYALNEFYESYVELKSAHQTTAEVNHLSTEINAVIAAFSYRTLQFAIEVFEKFDVHGWEDEDNGIEMIPANLRYDKKYSCNGYKCELIFCNSGYPQFYLDDDYGLNEAIGAYIRNERGNLSIQPTWEFKNTFDKLHNMRLLTAFNRL